MTNNNMEKTISIEFTREELTEIREYCAIDTTITKVIKALEQLDAPQIGDYVKGWDDNEDYYTSGLYVGKDVLKNVFVISTKPGVLGCVGFKHCAKIKKKAEF